MNSHLKFLVFGYLLIVAAFWQSPHAAAQFPFVQSSNKQVKLNLSPQDGPWLVICASFDGDDGKQQAVRLANELRVSHGLKSYVHREAFDFSKDIVDQGAGFQKPVEDGSGRVKRAKMKLAKGPGKVEYAVLVGDFKSIESKEAQETLARIKSLSPETLKLFSSDIGDSAQAGEKMRAASEALFGSEETGIPMSRRLTASKFPLRMSLLVQNPILPPEQQNQVDEYVIKINQYLKYSLLKNPGAYSLKVASFSGQSIVSGQKIQKLSRDESWLRKNREGKNNKGLVEAAKRAKILTKYLRSQGVEAYEFHDRYSSYVCVGSFDWVSKGEGSNVVFNPKVEQLAKQFQARPEKGGITTYKLPPRLLEAGVTCDASPLTVAVPTARGIRASTEARRR